MIIRIGMRCGYEGGWAKLLGIGSVLLDGCHSLRGAAPTSRALFGGLVWEPRLGAKLVGMGSALLDGRHSPRDAAPTGQRRFWDA